MHYGIILLIAGSGLVIYFVLATKASWIAKAVVFGLFIFSFASISYWIPVNPVIGSFLLVAVGIFIIFYRIVQQARWDK
jgi:hypothetical protein